MVSIVADALTDPDDLSLARPHRDRMPGQGRDGARWLLFSAAAEDRNGSHTTEDTTAAGRRASQTTKPGLRRVVVDAAVTGAEGGDVSGQDEDNVPLENFAPLAAT